EVKVVRRWPRRRPGEPTPRAVEMGLAQAPAKLRIVAIGASTGGPPVLQTILAALPKSFPVPVVIVQHMAAGFSRGFMEWLALSSALPLHLAAHGEHMRPGHVYLAPDEVQMKVARHERIVLTRDEPENGLRPSVSCLFRSVVEVYGCDAVAGLLTGMGRDGAEELRLLKEKGAITFAQDRESSVVHGMPGEAIRLDAAMLVLSPGKIAAVLTSLAENGHAQWRSK
ncbi:CheB methylesterase domain-containing protein, partial [Rhodoferax sp.]|uniref:CheB methylesterase domain-containing protein n=1 Tax=Rhodoferax sp. TaxID=50421 RepID=UPI003BB77F28